MSDTINNGIPLVPENTIDPAAGLNEALNVADALIQVDVISLTVTTPPASPVVGDRYIVPTGATGAWSGQAEKLARWEEGLFWAFYNAQFVTNNGVAYTKTSGGWAVISGSGEANTTSNLGAGEGIASPKSGVNLPFKSLKAGSNVTISSDANEITISSTGGGGGSSVWGGIGGDIEDQADLIDLLDEKEFELVAGANITINRSNPKAPVISASGGGGGGGQVDSVTAGEGIAVDNTDPENPEVSVDFSVAEYKLTAGTGIAIDRTDPDAPVISATGGGGGMTNPMTTAGDVIVGGASGAPQRLGVGSNGKVLGVSSGAPAWIDAPSGSGDVVGPSSATENALAQFDGATGKLLKSGPLVADFATAAQGALADSAVQPSDLSDVATSGDYDDLINKPTLGTAAAASSSDFATAAQGALADSAVQEAPLDGKSYARKSGAWTEIIASGTITEYYESEEFTATAGGLTTLTHGLSSVPKIILMEAVCIIDEHGYSVGDTVLLNQAAVPSGSINGIGTSVRRNSTNIFIRFGSSILGAILQASTGQQYGYTYANWKIRVRAWR